VAKKVDGAFAFKDGGSLFVGGEFGAGVTVVEKQRGGGVASNVAVNLDVL
jgi:vacuolar-type H+-ATPase catalytic subunit A/Vma1